MSNDEWRSPRVLAAGAGLACLIAACGDDSGVGAGGQGGGASTSAASTSGGATTSTASTTSATGTTGATSTSTAVGSGGGGASGTGGGGASGTGGEGGSSGEGGGTCAEDCQGFSCCGDACVNKQNDIQNCGGCGVECEGASPYCDLGTCGVAPCDELTDCTDDASCCGGACCDAGQLCCNIPGPVGDSLLCTEPTPEGTCPTGCVLCKCASEDTLIATPSGERPISTLRAGDLVYSVDRGGLAAVPLLLVERNPVRNHEVVQVELANGRILHISGQHPTADGRTFDDLSAGGELGGVAILFARAVSYQGDATYEILPASSTGTYVAEGVLVGSTLRGRVDALK